MREVFINRNFREMRELEHIIEEYSDFIRVEVVDTVSFKGIEFPIYCLVLGNNSPQTPAVGFFGGVHGLERIGSDVVLSYLHTILELVRWDKVYQQRLEESSLIFMPIVNPVGIAIKSRANGSGVDLMRNSPLDCGEDRLPLVSGHTISNKLPWYRGNYLDGMELEAQAMCDVVRKYLLPSRLSMAVDVHSGFGARDRFWFPFAHTKKPFPYIAQAYAFSELLDQTYPHHVYEIEPVCRQYTINGDIWDYLFLENQSQAESNFFMPWTLEMGSWNWLRKNPFQIFNRWGVFHPIKPHRRSRTLRRHLPLFDFIHRSCLSSDPWLDLRDHEKQRLEKSALERWYE